MRSSNAEIVANAIWLAHRYQGDADLVHFRHVPRAAHAEATFLTDDILGPGGEVVTIDRREAASLTPAPAPMHFIFHSAFCCSTMLARAFDLPGVAMGLKEPQIFNDLVGIRHRGEAQGPELAERLGHALQLLARPFAAGEAVVVKPSNVINALAPAMMAMRPNAKALLLHAPLEIYLKSILKKGLEGRLWVRDLLVKLITDNIIDLGMTAQDYLRLTDLQAAAVGWLAQQALFARMVEQYGPQRVCTLDSEALLADPARAMAALGAHFELALSDEAVGEIVRGPAFASHSKTGGDFSAEARDAEYAAAAAPHADELEKILHWAKVTAERFGIKMELGAGLLD